MADEPKEYYNATVLKLDFSQSKVKGKMVATASVDEAGVKVTKGKANTPHHWVKDVQTDLAAVGYGDAKKANGVYTGDWKRHTLRFQRHAKRIYRMKADKKIDDVATMAVFSGDADGVFDKATATELRKWIDQGWVLPLERFPIENLAIGGKLRKDAADAWDILVKKVSDKGGIIGTPYGDTLRPLKKTTKVGTSKFSFHYTGRAVDINQALGGGKGKRYYAVKEIVGTDTYWRLWCKTDKQDGTQGIKIEKKTKMAWIFSSKVEKAFPEGYYFDLTAEIESTGTFERIHAQKGWESSYNKTEWWHFQYKLDKQETFQDELEMIGIDEAKMRKNGWDTDTQLDHKPG